MNILNIFRKNILYFFLSLPIVIILYEILMLITLGNRGYTVLLLGQLGAVPLLLLFFDFLLQYDLLRNVVVVGSMLASVGLVTYFIYQSVKSQ